MFRRGAGHQDIERGRHPLHHPTSLRLLLRRYGFLLVLVACLGLWLLVSRGLHSIREKTAAFTTFDDEGTCATKLQLLGVDFSGHALERQTTYSRMDGNIQQHGLFLGGVITQGLKQADLFIFSDVSSQHATITPVLKPLDTPVRAMILPLLDEVAAKRIKMAVDTLLMPALPTGGVWLQDSKLYHATLFHASSHVTPVPATADEVQTEARAVQGVTTMSCPIRGVLDRIIVTASGVIVACWQVLPSGTEPADLRHDLAQALPKAPSTEGQMVKERTMLHTTIARLLQPPKELGEQVDAMAVGAAVHQLSSSLCGLTALFGDVWFVEEQDLLALALDGHFVKHEAPLICPRTT